MMPIDLPPMSAPAKRSVTIEGHRTSVSLEDGFWQALGRVAADAGVSRAVLIGQVDRARPPEVGLATALRLLVLARLQARAAGKPCPGPADPTTRDASDARSDGPAGPCDGAPSISTI